MEGLVGKVEPNWIVGWVYDAKVDTPFEIDIFYDEKLLGRGLANFYREDLLKETKHIKGKCGFRINIPNWGNQLDKLRITANGTDLEFSPIAVRKASIVKRALTIQNTKSHFFIHIPKTAGTAFRVLLEKQFSQNEIFPNKKDILNNNEQYPTFSEVLKYKEINREVNCLIGHYPFSMHHVFDKKPTMSILLRNPVQRVISNIFHMKNNDPNFKDLSPAQIYAKGSWHFINLQLRYVVDNAIHMHMRYLDSNPLGQNALNQAVKHLNLCDFVGISEDLSKSVKLSNKMFGWNLAEPKMVNVARSKKEVSPQLINQIRRDNQLDIKLYKAAKRRFEILCKTYEIN